MDGLTAENDEVALAIYQDHLNFLTECLLEGRFDEFADKISLPHHVRILNAEFVSRTREDVRDKFDQVSAFFRGERVTEVYRIAAFAAFHNDDEIIGEHVSHMLRGSLRVMDPFRNRVRLIRCRDGIWRETDCSNAVYVQAGRIGMLRSAQDKRPVPPLGDLSEGKKND